MKKAYQLKYIKGRKLRTFLAVARHIIPPESSNPGADSLQTAAIADWALNQIPAQLRRKLLLFIFVIEILGLFFGGRLFSKNSDLACENQLNWMERSLFPPFRMGFMGVKTYICLGYYTRADTWEAINYMGPTQPDRPYPDPVIRMMCENKIEVIP